MKKKDDAAYIAHVLECIGDVQAYAAEGRKTFLGDRKTQDAILRKLQIMAESTQRIAEETTKIMPEVPWRQLAGFRNILVHDYLGDLNRERVWHFIQNDLPRLKQALETYQKKAGMA